MSQHSLVRSQLSRVMTPQEAPGHPAPASSCTPQGPPYISRCNLAGRSGRGCCWLTFWSFRDHTKGSSWSVGAQPGSPCTPR